jgi:hypothetical protein
MESRLAKKYNGPLHVSLLGGGWNGVTKAQLAVYFQEKNAIESI